MDTALPQKFSFILDRNLAKANCTEDHVCTSCDKEVLGIRIKVTEQSEQIVNPIIVFAAKFKVLKHESK